MTIIIPVAIISGILAWTFRPQKGITRDRFAAILATVIPPAILFIVALVSQMLHNSAGNDGVSNISNTCFIISIGLLAATILVLVGFVIARKMEVVKGMAFGLTTTMFLAIADLALLEWLGGV